jgi:bla regulator protein blaR1
MTTPSWVSGGLALAGNHLWQSTLVAAIATVLALLLRRNRAPVRYWVWLAASAKFLVPFAALVAIGGQLSWRTVEVVTPPPDTAVLIETVSQPFSQEAVSVRGRPRAAASTSLLSALPLILATMWAAGCIACLLMWVVRWQRMRAIVRNGSPLASGREAEIVRRLAAGYGLRPLPIVTSETTLEPGVFGIVRPVLLWPRGISDRLSDEQAEAILAHELSHLRRRDNLTAALHMTVQAIFWFHPLVWWIGARLVDERERACDQDVVRLGSEPEVYAESILKTCKFYVESPLVCVTGVTGSDLKKRIEQIMTNDAAHAMTPWKKALLAAAGVVAFVTPVAVGALNPPPQTEPIAAPASLPAFEEISIRPNVTPGRGGRGGGQMQPGRYVAQNLTLRTIIKRAFCIPGATPAACRDLLDQQVAGGPEWLDADKFDIVATTVGQTQPVQMRLLIQRMLAERFKLSAHWERQELPVYVLTMARADGRVGPGLRLTPDEECAAARAAGPPPMPPTAAPGAPLNLGPLPNCGAIQFGPGQLVARGAPMEWLAQTLTTVPVVTGIDRPVLDRTGLRGNHGFTLKFAAAGSASPDPDRPELFTALQEQLGLKLEPRREPIDVLVVDRAEKPESN